MSEEGTDVGTVIAGVFLIILGLCVTLVGGACTAVWIALMFSEPVDSTSISLLLLSAAVLAAGIFAIVMGVRLIIKRSEP